MNSYGTTVATPVPQSGLRNGDELVNRLRRFRDRKRRLASLRALKGAFRTEERPGVIHMLFFLRKVDFPPPRPCAPVQILKYLLLFVNQLRIISASEDEALIIPRP